MSTLAQAIHQAWHRQAWWLGFLKPVAFLFGGMVRLRKAWLMRWRSTQLSVPVIVVGNIQIGGGGKTPLIMALAQVLKQHGYHPGIVSRGYKAKLSSTPTQVQDFHQSAEVGDEPKLMATSAQVPVVIGASRVKAAQLLLANNPQVNVVLSDDGLQHYKLARDLEIVMVDSSLANRTLLPCGPNREPWSRLKSADFVIDRADPKSPVEYALDEPYQIVTPDVKKDWSQFASQTVHAVAGIAFPERFFSMLKAKGLTIIEHPFGDHHEYTQSDLAFGDDRPILMTQKDAVKCAFNPNIWVVGLKATLSESFQQTLLRRIHDGRKTA